jgi:hypothetical protein
MTFNASSSNLAFPSSEEILLLAAVFIKNNDGYYMIATNIPFFQGIDQLPIILDPILLDEGGGIEETLRRNNAKYHQNSTQFQ